eukprot:Trichotokara_eunicae@DN6369_c0_g1_i3.p1
MLLAATSWSHLSEDEVLNSWRQFVLCDLRILLKALHLPPSLNDLKLHGLISIELTLEDFPQEIQEAFLVDIEERQTFLFWRVDCLLLDVFPEVEYEKKKKKKK